MPDKCYRYSVSCNTVRRRVARIIDMRGPWVLLSCLPPTTQLADALAGRCVGIEEPGAIEMIYRR